MRPGRPEYVKETCCLWGPLWLDYNVVTITMTRNARMDPQNIDRKQNSKAKDLFKGLKFTKFQKSLERSLVDHARPNTYSALQWGETRRPWKKGKKCELIQTRTVTSESQKMLSYQQQGQKDLGLSSWCWLLKIAFRSC